MKENATKTTLKKNPKNRENYPKDDTKPQKEKIG